MFPVLQSSVNMPEGLFFRLVSKGRTNDNKLSLVKSILLRLFAEGKPLFSGEVWKNA